MSLDNDRPRHAPRKDADPSFVRTLRHTSEVLGGLTEALALVLPDPRAAHRRGELSDADHEACHSTVEWATGLAFLADIIEATGTEEEGTLPVTKEFVRVVCGRATEVYTRASALVERLTAKAGAPS